MLNRLLIMILPYPIRWVLVVLMGATFHLAGYPQCESLISDRILYTVRLDDTTGQDEGRYAFMDPSERSAFVDQLCSLAVSGKITPTRYWGDRVYSLPGRYDVEKHFTVSDTAWKDLPTKKKSKRSTEPGRNDLFYRDLVNSLSFLEEWRFDGRTNTFTKVVKGVVLFQDKYTHNIGTRLNYYLPLESSADVFDLKNLIMSNIVYDVRVSDQHSRPCDDTNWWSDHLEASARERFFDLLTFKALKDSIAPLQVRSPTYPYDSVFQRNPYVNTGMNTLYHGRSNWYNSDPLMFGMTDEKIMACCYELSAWPTVTKIRFHESWYFDPDQLRFEKKLLDIGMIVDRYNDQGEIIGDTCLVFYHLTD